MQTHWNWSVLSWWRHNGRRHLRSDRSLCVRTLELWVAWLAIGMWWMTTIVYLFIYFVTRMWLACLIWKKGYYLIFRKKMFTIAKWYIHGNHFTWAARLCVQSVCQETRLCSELDVWALWCSIVVHHVACGFSFHISLFPTIATGTTKPAQCPARDLEK